MVPDPRQYTPTPAKEPRLGWLMVPATVTWALAAALIISAASLLANEAALLGAINLEEVHWIHGNNYGYPMRVLQALLYTTILPWLAGSMLFPYILPMLLLHLLNGLLICFLYRALFASTQGQSTAWIGGITAGIIFSTSAVAQVTVSYFAALAYPLVTFFALLMVLGALGFLRRGGARYWLLVLLAQELALLSHSLALGLPFFLLLLEGSVSGWRAWRNARAWFLARYSALGVLLAVHIFLFRQIYLEAADEASAAASDQARTGLAKEFLGYLADVLFSILPRIDHGSGHHRRYIPFIAAGTVLILALGIYRLARGKSRLRMPNVLLLFPLAWCAMSFLFLLHVHWGKESAPVYPVNRQLYLNSVGVAFFLGYLAAWRPSRLRRSQYRSLGLVLNVATILAAAAWVALSVAEPLAVARRIRARLPAHLAEDACGVSSAGSGARTTYLPVASLRGATYRGAALAGSCFALANLIQSDLSGARLSRANFRLAFLNRANLSKVHAPQATFHQANLQDADLRGGSFKGADFRAASMICARLDGARLQDALLQGADLTNALLREATLDGVQADGAILNGAFLAGASLRESSLRRVDLRQADLRGADLRGADLRRADLRGTILIGADLSGADLSGVHPEGVKLCGAKLGDARVPVHLLRNSQGKLICPEQGAPP